MLKHIATATVYFYCSDGNHQNLDLQKKIHIELKSSIYGSKVIFVHGAEMSTNLLSEMLMVK